MKLPEFLDQLGSGGFENCVSLSSITLPQSLTSVSPHLFYGCTDLKKISLLSQNISIIEERAFSYCSNLESLICLSTTPPECNGGKDVFYDMPFSTCKLYVPLESIDLYKTTSPWNEFYNIVEYSLCDGILLGDSNNDEKVNIADIVTTNNYIKGNNLQQFSFEKADVDGNSEIDEHDVLGTVDLIFDADDSNFTSAGIETDFNLNTGIIEKLSNGKIYVACLPVTLCS